MLDHLFRGRITALVVVAALSLLVGPARAIQSDDFSSSTLDTTLWNLVDPIGDAKLLPTGTNLLFHLEGGVSHDLWSTCNCAPRVVQAAADEDFEIEIKLDSRPTERFQFQGLIINQDFDTFLRFDVHYDGSTPRIFAAYMDGANATSRLFSGLPSFPSYLRVNRTGNIWTYSYSYDGTAWTNAGVFAQAMTVTEVGFFLGAHIVPESNTPTFTGNIDYFFDTANPILPEDGGNPTAPSPPVIEAWYGDQLAAGHLGIPQQWINVMGTVWDTDDLSSLSYTLNGGPSSPLTIGSDGLRLSRKGDYNIEIDHTDLNIGANQVVITAVDTLGEQSNKTVTVNFANGGVWAIPDTIDWSTANEISDVAQVVDGQWILTPNGVRTDSSATGYDRLIAAGDFRWLSDYEVVLPITIHQGALGDPGGIGLAIGWQGHTGMDQPRLGHPYEMVCWISGFPGNTTLQFLDGDAVRIEVPKVLQADVQYNLRIRSLSQGNGMSTVSARLWEDGMTEPQTWDLSDDFDTVEGSVLLVSHFSDVTFGNVGITPLVPFPEHVLTTTTVGNGSIVRMPNQGLYPDSAVVELTAVPDPGWSFVGWSGGLSGIQNPDTVVVMSDTMVTATFEAESYTLSINIDGNGTVLKSPDQPSYTYGDTILVTAFPDSGLAFNGWAGDLMGLENPATIVITNNMAITAFFGPPAYILTVNVNGLGSVVKTPDKPLYDSGEQVILSAVPSAGWLFGSWADGLTGTANPETVVVFNDTLVTANFVPVGAITSDDFSSAALDTTLWRVIDPVGDATLLATGTNMLFHVEGGISHDLWSTCNCAPRVLQGAPNGDFEIEMKLDSKPTERYQFQGFVINQDLGTFLRFDVHHDGTTPRILAAYIDGADILAQGVEINTSLPVAPSYLRVTRTGDSWEYSYSYDGVDWTSAGVFTQVLTVTEVGFFMGAHLSTDSRTPTFTGNVDYFFNTANPITPEDGGLPTAPSPPVVKVWYGDQQPAGHLGTPQQWFNVVGTVWDPDPMASLSYTLNGGPSMPLTIGTDGLRLSRKGDYNIEIDHTDLVAGANQVLITAVDSLGEQTDKMVTVNFTEGVVWTIPEFVDWSAATQVSDVAQVVDGQWILTPDGVRTDSSATGYDRLLAVGDYRWSSDYEVVLPITVHRGGLGDPGGIGLAIGWDGHTGTGQPRLGHPYEMVCWLSGFPNNIALQFLDGDAVRAQVPKGIQNDVQYNMKIRSLSLGNGMSTVSARVWEDGTPEPQTWDLSDNFTTRGGSVLLVSHFSDVTFGDMSITPLTAGPTHVLTTNTLGNGSIVRMPNLGLYPDSTVVLLTPVPDPGWIFVGWSDGLSGTENPDTVLMVSDTTVTATFVQTSFVLTANTVGNGTVIRSPDQPTYLLGDTVFVTALPDTGWLFAGWTGGLGGAENPDTVVVASDTTVTAVFVQQAFVFTASASGNGTVTRSPDQPSYVLGDTVFVTAVPDTGWLFAGWTGGLGGAENPDTVVVASDTTVTGVFVQQAFVLTASASGNGTVTRSPDQPSYLLGDTVFVTALPDTGWLFAGWTGGLGGAENPDTVVVASDTTVTAVFVQQAFVLTANTVGNGTVTRSPDQPSYVLGDTVFVTALPDTGWLFAGWTGGLGGAENPDTVVVLSDTTVTATFTQEAFVLTINAAGTGLVLRAPSQPSYAFGDTVIITALADPGWSFLGWSDGLTGSENPDTIVMMSDTTVTASFAQDAFVLTANTVGDGTVTRTPEQPSYLYGDTVLVTAAPDMGWDFAGWSGGLSGAENPDTIVMMSDTTVTATFSQQTFVFTINTVGNGSVMRFPDQPDYLYGDTVLVTAMPDTGWNFVGWDEGLIGTENPDTVIVVMDTTVTANFEDVVTGIGDDAPRVKTLTVGQNYPNPFTHSTQVDYGLPSSGDVRLEIYDAAGRRVYIESIKQAPAGWSRFQFDGSDRSGKRLPSGVYFYRINALGETKTRKMVILR